MGELEAWALPAGLLVSRKQTKQPSNAGMEMPGNPLSIPCSSVGRCLIFPSQTDLLSGLLVEKILLFESD